MSEMDTKPPMDQVSSGLGQGRQSQGGMVETRSEEPVYDADGQIAGVEYDAHLPVDIVGGSIPHVPGTEKEAVWNAAAQACGTERVHFAYTIDDNRCWYLACPSSSLASHPDSWCPLVSALPGNSEYWDRDTVYVYDQEGYAAALRWDNETGRMQVFSGASRSILPRVQTMDANFVTITADSVEPVGWYNRALAQEELSRKSVKWMTISGLAVLMTSLVIWLAMAGISTVYSPDLRSAQNETQAATTRLIVEAGQALRDDTSRHLARIQELLDTLGELGGTLEKYEIKDGKVVWEALVPPALSGNSLQQFDARSVGRADDGRIRIRGTG